MAGHPPADGGPLGDDEDPTDHPGRHPSLSSQIPAGSRAFASWRRIESSTEVAGQNQTLTPPGGAGYAPTVPTSAVAADLFRASIPLARP